MVVFQLVFYCSMHFSLLFHLGFLVSLTIERFIAFIFSVEKIINYTLLGTFAINESTARLETQMANIS